MQSSPRSLEESSVRVLIETLRLSKAGNRCQIIDIASSARATESFARRVLTSALGEPDDSGVSLSPRLRIRLALHIAQAGRLRDSARVLTWQEFEKFAQECLGEAGFQTEKNVRVKGDGRAWQIDLVGVRGGLILTVDCKHWNTPGFLSRFRLAADHQRTASRHFLAATREKSIQGNEERLALPVILTLSEPPAQFTNRVALVSVEKLPSFLAGVTLYDQSLPFIDASPSVENPMSQSK